jgi:hypothetical protein
MAARRTIAGLVIRARRFAACMFTLLRGSWVSSPNRDAEHRSFDLDPLVTWAVSSPRHIGRGSFVTTTIT